VALNWLFPSAYCPPLHAGRSRRCSPPEDEARLNRRHFVRRRAHQGAGGGRGVPVALHLPGRHVPRLAAAARAGLPGALRPSSPPTSKCDSVSVGVPRDGNGETRGVSESHRKHHRRVARSWATILYLRRVSAMTAACWRSTAMQKLRIVTLGISGGGSLGAVPRRPPISLTTMVHPVPRATRTTLGFGICPSFKDRSLSRRAKP
jgi:hypothetical protein